MTVHRKQSQKREKSKIILPLQTDTTLLPKKRKTATNKKKTDKNKTDIYTKSKHNSRTDSLNIKNILAIQHKVHSVLVWIFYI
jgi:hypothetical protein